MKLEHRDESHYDDTKRAMAADVVEIVYRQVDCYTHSNVFKHNYAVLALAMCR